MCIQYYRKLSDSLKVKRLSLIEPRIIYTYFAHFSLRKDSRRMRSSRCVTYFKILNQLTDFHDAWYECYAVGFHPITILFIFLRSQITVQRTHELLKQERHLFYGLETIYIYIYLGIFVECNIATWRRCENFLLAFAFMALTN